MLTKSNTLRAKFTHKSSLIFSSEQFNILFWHKTSSHSKTFHLFNVSFRNHRDSFLYRFSPSPAVKKHNYAAVSQIKSISSNAHMELRMSICIVSEVKECSTHAVHKKLFLTDRQTNKNRAKPHSQTLTSLPQASFRALAIYRELQIWRVVLLFWFRPRIP